LRIVFFGTPDFAVLPLKKLLDSGHEVVAVVTQPDRQSGRGRRVKPCPVKVEALNAGLKVMQPLKVREPDFVDELKSLNPSIIIVVAYGQILPPDIIDMPEFGCVNIHASLLPKYRGAAPVNWAIINGEEKTGVTIMLMDEGMDTGPLLLQEEVKIAPDDTTGSLLEKLSEIGADILLPAIEGLGKGSIKPEAQPDGASYAPIMKKTDGLINWSKQADELSSFINGMNPWPGAYSFIENERVKILQAVPDNSAEGPVCKEEEGGVIARADKGGLLVCTGSGSLSILEIQPPGKPVMPVKAFLQGRKLKEGTRFQSS
jgi:methionyl-tRNA formyltransferase